jgi:hypothetical protein
MEYWSNLDLWSSDYTVTWWHFTLEAIGLALTPNTACRMSHTADSF